MLRRQSRRPRRGASLVDAVIAYPIVFLLVVVGMILALWVSRMQQVTWLAHVGARYASVHGAQYAANTGNAAASTTDIQTYVRGFAGGLDPNSVTVTTTWNPNNGLTHTSGTSTVQNTVSVTVSYPWASDTIMGISIGGTALSSTSVMTMSY